MERWIRLRRPTDFERVRREGRSWSHPLLVLVALANEFDYTRVGVTASRRVGRAVARNRAKRLLREAARRFYPRLLPGWDLVLISRPGIVGTRKPQVEEALNLLLKRAGLFVKESAQ